MRFSQRAGFTPVEKQIQLGSIDRDLKNGLWNMITSAIDDNSVKESALGKDIWHNFFKLRIEDAPYRDLTGQLSKWFFDAKRPWYEIYDFIEFLVDERMSRYGIRAWKLRDELNGVLERESSAYRLIGSQVTPITNEVELTEISTALEQSSVYGLKGVRIHLEDALTKLSDRQNPDYRNAIKESISAVESLAKVLSKKSSASLTDALKALESKLPIHSALKKGLEAIYGYTSDSGGIRHSLMDEPNLDFDDAKFMLVSCSAFVNYLIAKANKAGILN